LPSFTVSIAFIDCILIFTLTEWLVLCVRYQIFKNGLNLADISLGLLPGFFLMLGIRVAAGNEVPIEVFVFLALSGLTHATDFYRRYRLCE